MKRKLFIFIGDSDKQSGDYAGVHRLAKRVARLSGPV
jgi:hypothetical protein